MTNKEKEYIKMVRLITKKPEVILHQLNNDKIDLLHGVMGIASELSEVIHYTDHNNLLEETGDMLFYITNLRDSFPFIGAFEKGDTPCLVPTIYVGEIIDAAKKIIIYDQEFNEELKTKIKNNLNLLETFLYENLYDVMKMKREDAMDHNMFKLFTGPNARYKNGYSDFASKERSDKQEQQEFSL